MQPAPCVESASSFPLSSTSASSAKRSTPWLRRVLAPIELIVVDDGSKDGSHEAIRRALGESGLASTRFLEQPNQGAHAAIARGVEASSGDVIAVLNSDDRFHPERLARILSHAPEKGRLPGLLDGANDRQRRRRTRLRQLARQRLSPRALRGVALPERRLRAPAQQHRRQQRQHGLHAHALRQDRRLPGLRSGPRLGFRAAGAAARGADPGARGAPRLPDARGERPCAGRCPSSERRRPNDSRALLRTQHERAAGELARSLSRQLAPLLRHLHVALPRVVRSGAARRLDRDRSADAQTRGLALVGRCDRSRPRRLLRLRRRRRSRSGAALGDGAGARGDRRRGPPAAPGRRGGAGCAACGLWAPRTRRGPGADASLGLADRATTRASFSSCDARCAGSGSRPSPAPGAERGPRGHASARAPAARRAHDSPLGDLRRRTLP